MDMREKIARALCDDTLSRWRSPIALHAEPWREFLPAADAVLDAMREPTEDMVVAGIIERHGSETPEAWKLATANIFTAMIDAALAGSPLPGTKGR